MADGGGAGPSSLSFGFAKSKKAQKVAVNIEEQGERRQLITAVEGSRIRTAEDERQVEDKPLVIQKIENTYRAGPKKLVPSFVPLANDAPVAGSGADRFEAAAASTIPTITEYGLQKRDRPAGAGSDAAAAAAAGLGESAAAVRRLAGAQQEEDAYRRDMEALPDSAPTEVGDLAQFCMHGTVCMSEFACAK